MSLINDDFKAWLGVDSYLDFMKGLPELNIQVFSFDEAQVFQEAFGYRQSTDVVVHTYPEDGVILRVYVSNKYSPFWQAHLFLKGVGFALRELGLKDDEKVAGLVNQMFYQMSPQQAERANEFADEVLVPKKKFLGMWNEALGDARLLKVNTGLDEETINAVAYRYGVLQGF